jgi:hypothetical protein
MRRGRRRPFDKLRVRKSLRVRKPLRVRKTLMLSLSKHERVEV